MSSQHSPLVVVVGETASGKSALALELARQFNGEIIAADSRTLYRGMDIGTAKPTMAERRLVRHHLIDVTTPDKPITVARYKQLTQAALSDISARGKLPILVGGTGLYVDAVIFDYQFAGEPNSELRQKLEGASVEELQARLLQAGIRLPANARNSRHLLRQLETGGIKPLRTELCARTLVLGLQLDSTKLEQNIQARVTGMFESGLEREVRNLANTYGWDCQALQTIGYQEFRPYFEGKATTQEVQEKIVRSSLQYAKRQRTWFKRNKHIQYICKKEDAVDLVTTFLNNWLTTGCTSLLQ